MRGRPAETGGALGAAATALAAMFGASTDQVAAVGIVAGLVPATITFLVANGGVKGLCSRLYRGR